jgi:hypothetical protein
VEPKALPFTFKQEPDTLLASVVEGYAAVFGNVDDRNDLINPGAFTKTITENGGRIKMGWQHAAPFGTTTYIAEVSRHSRRRHRDRDGTFPAARPRTPPARARHHREVGRER